ncbi:Tetratricopeptide repeat-containing protein [Flavobacterium longum]|uniref:hypothetical protein n=1 Tax=Flavobacterium longum TaxID=1299340 RepID=UPI0039EC4176
MKKAITTIVLLVSVLAGAQGKFEEGMGKAFQLWGEGKPDEASAMFERIASAEKNSWLPNYYVALVNTTSSFQSRDKERVSALLKKAQDALDIEFVKDPNNPEFLIMQAMIYTGWVAFDPQTYAMTYSSKVMELYTKAQVLDPTNPRAVFCKAEYEMGGAKYFGSDIKPMCAEVDRSIALFENFKPASPLHPKWGLDRALATQKECNKK